jgi:nucleoside-diphosphate-sugar epimerase
MSPFFEMAKKGRVYLVGDGSKKMNPIHGSDLAKCCVNALDKEESEIDIGGPEVMTYREMAELAFRTLGRPAQITALPVWIVKAVVAATRLVNKHQGELLAFFTTAMSSDVVAPTTGTRRLDAHFRELTGVS